MSAMQNCEYITEKIVEKTKYKSVADAFNRDYFSVVRQGGFFWIESRLCPERTHKLIIKETKRLFPNLEYVM